MEKKLDVFRLKSAEYNMLEDMSIDSRQTGKQ